MIERDFSMKRWIKQLVYRLLGDSRRDIIGDITDELRQEKEELTELISSLKDQLAQLREGTQGLRAIADRQESIWRDFVRREQQLHIHMDMAARDMQIILSQMSIPGNPFDQEKQFVLQTDAPVAYESPDHLHPWGTKNDNTRAPFFIKKCESLFPEKRRLRFADLGCAGGGIVLDALLRGHRAIGLEGSDYSRKSQRAEWRLLRNNLFTCDIAKPYSIWDLEGKPVLFDIVSAWEVFEHIPEEGVPQMLKNIANMLAPGGYFVGTVSQTEDYEPESGAQLHVTIQPPEWWYTQAEKAGLWRAENVFEPCDLARAYGNPPLPWLLGWGLERSPYLVLQKPL